MSTETVARRYAGALADVVLKNGQTETVKSELRQWAEMMSQNQDLLTTFRNPAIFHHDKEQILERLIEKTRPSATTANFLKILLRNGRLTELADINDRFDQVLQERSGIVLAKVKTARALSEPEAAELKSNLERMTGRRVNVNFEIDRSIIGGVVTTIGSTVYDGSVKSQLEQLKEQLINN